MSRTLPPTSSRALPGAFHAPARAHIPLWQRLRTMAALARQRRDLARLDDHLRRDIGLDEPEIEVEISRPVWDIPSWWR